MGFSDTERDGGAALQNGIDRRQDAECREGREQQTADHGAAERRRLRAALARADRHRQHAEDHRGGGHQDGAQSRPGAFARRPRGRARPSWRARSANVTSRIEFATAMPIAMIAPMNDWTFSVVPVSRSMSNTPQRTAGMVSRIASASRSDWKFAASSRKIASTASSSPMRKPESGLLQRRDLAAQPHAEAARRRAGGRDRPLQQRRRLRRA